MSTNREKLDAFKAGTEGEVVEDKIVELIHLEEDVKAENLKGLEVKAAADAAKSNDPDTE